MNEWLITGKGQPLLSVWLWVFQDSRVLDAVVPRYLLSRSCSNLSFKSHNDYRTDLGTRPDS